MFILPQLYRGQSTLPEGCLLREERDVLLAQERMKSRQVGGDWMCGICGKRFETEWYLDKHMEKRHTDYQVSDTALCLADLCGVLMDCGVPPVTEFRGGKEVVVGEQRTQPAWCKDSVELKARRRSCISILRNCVASPSQLPALDRSICEDVARDQCASHTIRTRRRSTTTFERSSAHSTLRRVFGIIFLSVLLFLLVLLRVTYYQQNGDQDLRIPSSVRFKAILRRLYKAD